MQSSDQAMIRVLVVDDSAFMRRAISTMLASDPTIEVVGTAGNGKIGIEKIQALRPDLVTMDIQMPVMDGITALQRIMKEFPTNVIIISSLTQAGSTAAMQAFAAGAVDVLAKDHSMVSDTIHELRDELVSRVKLLAKRDPTRRSPRLRRLDATGQKESPEITRTATPARAPVTRSSENAAALPEMTIGGTIRFGAKRFRPEPVDLICIGSSTGGPSVVEEIIVALPADLRVPVVVAQHMPFLFTKSMSERFNGIAAVPVIHASDRMPIERGKVYIAPGGQHLQLVKRGGQIFASVALTPEGYIYKPSVDVLFSSAAKLGGVRILGVVLTGMGSDGAEGAKELVAAGGTVLAQDKESSVVYGMPRAVAEAGIAAGIMPPSALAAAVAQAGAALRASA